MRQQETVNKGLPPARSEAAPVRPARLSASAATDFGQSQAVHDSWRAYIARLPAGARLLDIASGIGPLALIARPFGSCGFREVKVRPFRADDAALIGWDLQAA